MPQLCPVPFSILCRKATLQHFVPFSRDKGWDGTDNLDQIKLISVSCKIHWLQNKQFTDICGTATCVFQTLLPFGPQISRSFNTAVIERNDKNYKGGSLFLQSHHHVTVTNRLVRSACTCAQNFHIIDSHWPKAAVLCCGVITESGNILSHFYGILAVRTSQRYDLTSWSSRPPWWNAVIQDICEAKGSWTLPTLFTYTLYVCVGAWLCGNVERCQRVGFLNPIVPFHCVGVFVWSEQAPCDIFPKRSLMCYFKVW